jgi:heme-degrading monooxygenase HmoA
MFVVLWEYEVKPGCEERFETVYGPSGDWARLFGRDPAYRETLLLRDPFRERTYLTLDFWDSRAAYEAFLGAHLTAYTAFDRACESLTSAERKVGSYERLPENE